MTAEAKPADERPIGRIRRFFGRIGVRLLMVNLTVLIVPMMGLEFARIYERQLLSSLERDMRNQSAIARAALENDLELGGALPDVARHSEAVLTRAAQSTRTRIRLLDADSKVVGTRTAPARRRGKSRRYRACFPTSAAPPAKTARAGPTSGSATR